jgi:hypothetical protein
MATQNVSAQAADGKRYSPQKMESALLDAKGLCTFLDEFACLEEGNRSSTPDETWWGMVLVVQLLMKKIDVLAAGEGD